MYENLTQEQARSKLLWFAAKLNMKYPVFSMRYGKIARMDNCQAPNMARYTENFNARRAGR